MENSNRFFANTACRYYPCHQIEGELNCLFCYCPLYFLPDCGGNCSYTDKGIEDCSDCLLIHDEHSWEFIQRRLIQENKRIAQEFAEKNKQSK